LQHSKIKGTYMSNSNDFLTAADVARADGTVCAVASGLRVARLGDSGRRMLFSAEFCDEFLVAQAQPVTLSMRERGAA
jgi:hypothetical protein